MLKILIALFALSSGHAFAEKDNDLCLCQTGTEPRSQVGFFKMGCKMWNAGQSCTKKLTTSYDTPMEEILSKYPEAKKIRVGYVGHWSSAHESVHFLQSKIVPAIRQFDVSFSIDNTACLATDNPYVILKYLRTIPEASRIDFRGNQAISTGLWDKILEGKNNFWARISGEELEVSFPKCKTFENEICSREFQNGETGVCADDEEGSHVILRCEEKEIMVTQMDPNGKRPRKVKVKKGFWKRMALDYKTLNLGPYVVARENEHRGPEFLFKEEAEATDFVSQVMRDVRVLLKKEAGVR